MFVVVRNCIADAAQLRLPVLVPVAGMPDAPHARADLQSPVVLAPVDGMPDAP